MCVLACVCVRLPNCVMCVHVCVASALPNIACLPRPYELRKHSYLLSYPQTPRTHSYLSPRPHAPHTHSHVVCHALGHAPRTYCYAGVTWNTRCTGWCVLLWQECSQFWLYTVSSHLARKFHSLGVPGLHALHHVPHCPSHLVFTQECAEHRLMLLSLIAAEKQAVDCHNTNICSVARKAPTSLSRANSQPTSEVRSAAVNFLNARVARTTECHPLGVTDTLHWKPQKIQKTCVARVVGLRSHVLVCWCLGSRNWRMCIFSVDSRVPAIYGKSCNGTDIFGMVSFLRKLEWVCRSLLDIFRGRFGVQITGTHALSKSIGEFKSSIVVSLGVLITVGKIAESNQARIWWYKLAKTLTHTLRLFMHLLPVPLSHWECMSKHIVCVQICSEIYMPILYAII